MLLIDAEELLDKNGAGPIPSLGSPCQIQSNKGTIKFQICSTDSTSARITPIRMSPLLQFWL
jgi:hypothetical protein